MNRFNAKISYGSAPPPQNTNIIIVGGGLNGLQLAIELWSLEVRGVSIIEVGSIEGLEHNSLTFDKKLAEKLWLQPETDPSFWQPWESKTPPFYSCRSGLRSKFGGRSLYWQGITIPIEEWALNDPVWPKQIVKMLKNDWIGGKSLYELMFEDIKEWVRYPITTSSLKESTKNLFTALNVASAQIAPAMVQHHYLKNNTICAAAYSPIEMWTRKDLIDDNNIPSVHCGYIVTRVLVDQRKAVGLQLRNKVTGETTKIFSNHIILAGGTIENSRLAIQALTEKKVLKDPVLKGLMDHIVQGFVVRVQMKDIPKNLQASVQCGPIFYVVGDDCNRSNIFFTFCRDSDSTLIIDVWVIGEQLPNENNYVKCIQQDGWPWKTIINAKLTDTDENIINIQRGQLNEFWHNICQLCGHPFEKLQFNPFDKSENSLPEIVFQYSNNTLNYFKPLTWANPPGTVDHEGGTLPFGKILNERSEFCQIPNLYAVGACCFPRMGAANPALTSMSLVKNLAYCLQK